MGRLSGLKSHHNCHYKKEAEGGDTHRDGERDVRPEAELAVMWPQGEECQRPPEAGRDNGWILP